MCLWTVQKLKKKFSAWLLDAGTPELESDKDKVVSIICPHAGYSYCGKTAAHAYSHIKMQSKEMLSDFAFCWVRMYSIVQPNKTCRKNVVILGPDHFGIVRPNNGRKKSKAKCFVSNADFWETPFGNVKVNQALIKKHLIPTNMFGVLSNEEDTQEHSLELIMPFLTYVLRNVDDEDIIDNFQIIPIIVGHCDSQLHSIYGQIMSQFMKYETQDFLFVISSDFCHWGSNYHYQPMPSLRENNNEQYEIHQFIRDLDAKAMHLISQLNYDSFIKYLSKTQNTVCGQNPIAILLKAVQYAQTETSKFRMSFVDYSQSNKVINFNDYSVSYAAAVLSLSHQTCDEKVSFKPL